jgi:hypothetical protein
VAVSFAEGQTAVIIPVPEVEPVVEVWRERFDPVWAVGVPAHLTVVYPFVPAARLSAADREDLGRLVGAHPRFTIIFGRCGRFPGVLYLVPEPDQPVRALTADLVARWPDAPPYGGVFAEVVPHLTITDGAEPGQMLQAEQAVVAALPLTCSIRRLWLMTYHGAAWTHSTDLPLGAAAQT